MSEVPKITFHIKTPEEEALGREKIERTNRFIDATYGETVDEIISKIPEHLSGDEKLAALYGVFLDTMEYDIEWGKNVNDSGLVSRPANSGFKTELTLEDGERADLSGRGKDLAIIKNTGVCTHFSDAFADIATRMGISCETVVGRTSLVSSNNGKTVELGHMWNQVLLDGEIKNIDVTYGLFASDEAIKQEKGLMPEVVAANFFLIDSGELRRIGPHHDFEDSAELLNAARAVAAK